MGDSASSSTLKDALLTAEYELTHIIVPLLSRRARRQEDGVLGYVAGEKVPTITRWPLFRLTIPLTWKVVAVTHLRSPD